jgi:hypothetical protein
MLENLLYLIFSLDFFSLALLTWNPSFLLFLSPPYASQARTRVPVRTRRFDGAPAHARTTVQVWARARKSLWTNLSLYIYTERELLPYSWL